MRPSRRAQRARCVPREGRLRPRRARGRVRERSGRLEPDSSVFEAHKQDGDWCPAGEEIAEVTVRRALLTAERTALNFLQRLSGIATRARRFVDAAGGRITVLDTRKTTPTLRVLEKYAVRAGGAHQPSRRAVRRDPDQGQPHPARRRRQRRRSNRARAHRPGLPIEIEAQSLDAGRRGARGRRGQICSTTCPLDEIREAVARTRRSRADRDLRRRHARSDAGARRDRRRLRFRRRADAFGARHRHQL